VHDRLRGEVEQSKVAEQEATRGRAEIGLALERQQARLSQSMADAEAARRAEQSLRDQAERAAAVLAQLHAKLDQSNADGDAVRGAHRMACDAADVLRAELTGLRMESQRQQQELERTIKSNERLQASLEGCKQEEGRLRAELGTLRPQADWLEQDLERLNRERSKLEEQLDRARQDMDEARLAATQGAASLRSEASAEGAGRRAAEKQAAHLQTMVLSLQKDLDAERSSHQAHSAKWAAELSSVRSDLAIAQQEQVEAVLLF
jgi:chromosome segregation ATPase